MFVNVARKLMYFRVPKTGSATLFARLQKSGFKLHDFDAHGKFKDLKQNKAFADFYKFCFVRSPYERLYSAFCYQQNLGLKNNTIDFNQFLTQLGDPIKMDIYYHPQTEWMVDDKGNKIMDFVGRVESYEEDFLKLCMLLKLEVSSENRNVIESPSEDKSYLKYYNAHSIHKVNTLYKEDFDCLNYNMLSPSNFPEERSSTLCGKCKKRGSYV